jgi:hypothetical protein
LEQRLLFVYHFPHSRYMSCPFQNILFSKLWNVSNSLTSILVRKTELWTTRAIRKVTSCELLKKTTRTNLLYTKKYILKLLLNVVTALIKAFSVSGNKFLYACVKEVCRHWAQSRFDTFHQLLIIVETILSKTCDNLAYMW